MLANALESAAQNDIERKKLTEYKGKIEAMDAEERKLYELRAQIRELSFAKGKRDTEQLAELKSEATKSANRINTYDKQLLNLEAATPLQNVLTREKERAKQRAEKRGREAMAQYRQKVTEREREKREALTERYRDSRQAALAKQAGQQGQSSCTSCFIPNGKEFSVQMEKADSERARASPFGAVLSPTESASEINISKPA